MESKKKYPLMAFMTLMWLIGQMGGPLVSTANSASPVVGVQTFGSSYGELSARWWQWALSIPVERNPILDTTGGNCAEGQLIENHTIDDVWFLAGAFGGTVTRYCTVPAGMPLFFPLLNAIAFKPFGYETLLDLRLLISKDLDNPTELTCSIDGVALKEDFSKFRVRSPSFTVIMPTKGLIPPGQTNVPGNTDPIVSDGYWLLLNPLPKGNHTIKFRSAKADGFLLDVTYHLTVQ